MKAEHVALGIGYVVGSFFGVGQLRRLFREAPRIGPGSDNGLGGDVGNTGRQRSADVPSIGTTKWPGMNG